MDWACIELEFRFNSTHSKYAFQILSSEFQSNVSLSNDRSPFRVCITFGEWFLHRFIFYEWLMVVNVFIWKMCISLPFEYSVSPKFCWVDITFSLVLWFFWSCMCNTQLQPKRLCHWKKIMLWFIKPFMVPIQTSQKTWRNVHDAQLWYRSSCQPIKIENMTREWERVELKEMGVKPHVNWMLNGSVNMVIDPKIYNHHSPSRILNYIDLTQCLLKCILMSPNHPGHEWPNHEII